MCAGRGWASNACMFANHAGSPSVPSPRKALARLLQDPKAAAKAAASPPAACGSSPPGAWPAASTPSTPYRSTKSAAWSIRFCAESCIGRASATLSSTRTWETRREGVGSRRLAGTHLEIHFHYAPVERVAAVTRNYARAGRRRGGAWGVVGVFSGLTRVLHERKHTQTHPLNLALRRY